MNKQTKLNRSEKMIAYSAFRLLTKGEAINFKDIVKACFGNVERARLVMDVVNVNIINYNNLTTRLAKSQYLTSNFTYIA